VGPALRNGIGDQVMPGTGKTTTSRTPAHQGAGVCRPSVVLSDTQQGANLCALPSRTSTTRSSANPLTGVACTWCAGRCRFGLASVSAFEHPDSTCGCRGLLDRFPGLAAP
jgi:hypothetical protein